MKEVSARPAVMFSWTAWGSASPRVQTCGSPQTWSSAQGGPSPAATAVPGEERWALAVCCPSPRQGPCALRSLPSMPPGQCAMSPSTSHPAPPRNRRFRPRALPWERTQGVNLQIRDGATAAVGVLVRRRGTRHPWSELQHGLSWVSTVQTADAGTCSFRDP